MKGLERLLILSKVRDKKLLQKDAAELLDLSPRHIYNLVNDLIQFGPEGLISRSGKTGNNKINIFFKERILTCVRENFADFGPTLASEYLESEYGLIVRQETLRRWMIDAGIWNLKCKRKKKIHPLRPKKTCFGMMIQIDGSHHAWFEERGRKCVLMVMVDDATNLITALHFCESEGFDAYCAVFKKHVLVHGIPLSLYGDHCGTLRKPKSDPYQYSSSAHIIPHGLTAKHFSQFRSAMSELGCKVICANSSQAKGLVERYNGVLQDRLIKFLRRKKISTIADANAIVPAFITYYNEKFEKIPEKPENLHLPLGDIKIDTVLCRRYKRVVSKDSVIQFMKNFYFIPPEEIQSTCKTIIEIRLLQDKTIKAFYEGKEIEIKLLSEVPELLQNNPLKMHQRRSFHPSSTHPWRHYKKKQKEDILPSVKDSSTNL